MTEARANEGKTVITTLSPKYVSTWGRREALREVIQNALDVENQFAKRFSLFFDGSKLHVSDGGPGISLRHLAMGLSEKGEESIGQFGEGLKLALLVYAREGGFIEVKSNGYTIRPRVMMHPDLATSVLAFDVSFSAEKTEGVYVVAEATKEQVEWAQTQFSRLQVKRWVEDVPQWNIKVSLPAGQVFFNGQSVLQAEMLFSWHFKTPNRQAINRDRTVVAHSELTQLMRYGIKAIGSEEVIESILHAACLAKSSPSELRPLEVNCNFWPSGESDFQNPKTWRRVIERKWGKRACLADTDAAATQQATFEGWTVINVIDDMRNLLSTFLPFASSVILEGGSKRLVADVPPETQTMLRKAMAAVNRSLQASAYGFRLTNANVKVCRKLTKAGKEVAGMADMDAGMAYITMEALERLPVACQVLLHETCHLVSRSNDLTTSFLTIMEDLAGSALAML